MCIRFFSVFCLLILAITLNSIHTFPSYLPSFFSLPDLTNLHPARYSLVACPCNPEVYGLWVKSASVTSGKDTAWECLSLLLAHLSTQRVVGAAPSAAAHRSHSQICCLPRKTLKASDWICVTVCAHVREPNAWVTVLQSWFNRKVIYPLPANVIVPDYSENSLWGILKFLQTACSK